MTVRMQMSTSKIVRGRDKVKKEVLAEIKENGANSGERNERGKQAGQDIETAVEYKRRTSRNK